jgi:hypothetical protein
MIMNCLPCWLTYRLERGPSAVDRHGSSATGLALSQSWWRLCVRFFDRVFRRRDVEQVAAQVQLELPMAGDAEILLQLVSGAGMIADFQGAESAKFGHARHVAVRDARTLMSQQCFQGRGNPCL